MSFLNDVINIVIKYYPQLLSGVGNTMLIALTSTVAGLVIGLLTGVIRTAPYSHNALLRTLHKILNAVIAVYVEIFRGTPMMVQAMVIYWGYAFLNDGATLPLIPAGLFMQSVKSTCSSRSAVGLMPAMMASTAPDWTAGISESQT